MDEHCGEKAADLGKRMALMQKSLSTGQSVPRQNYFHAVKVCSHYTKVNLRSVGRKGNTCAFCAFKCVSRFVFA